MHVLILMPTVNLSLRQTTDHVLGINSLILKTVACLTMLLDHIGYHSPSFPAFRMIGRISFPIFAYLIAVGCLKSTDIYKYLFRVIIFGIVSEPLYDLCFYGKISIGVDNVMFTISLGIISVICIDKLKNSSHLAFLSVIPSFFCMHLADRFSMDYGAWGVALIILYYLFLYSGRTPSEKGISKEKESSSLGDTGLRKIAIRKAVLSGAAISIVTLAFALRYELKYFILSSLYSISSVFPLLSSIISEAPAAPSSWQNQQVYAVFALLFILAYNGKRGINIKNGRLRKLYQYSFYAFYPAHLLVLTFIVR